MTNKWQATTIAALLIAVAASIFAIWPVVADAPWKSEVPVAVSTNPLMCEAALELRLRIVFDRPRSTGIVVAGSNDVWQNLLDRAERDIDTYC